MLKDIHDPQGGKLADQAKVLGLVQRLAKLEARKWVKKDDPEKYGLKDPQMVVTLHTRKDEKAGVLLTASVVASIAGRIGPLPLPPFGSS